MKEAFNDTKDYNMGTLLKRVWGLGKFLYFCSPWDLVIQFAAVKQDFRTERSKILHVHLTSADSGQTSLANKHTSQLTICHTCINKTETTYVEKSVTAHYIAMKLLPILFFSFLNRNSSYLRFA